MTRYDETPLLGGYDNGDWLRLELDADLEIGPVMVVAKDHQRTDVSRIEGHTLGYTLEGPNVWDAVGDEVDSEVLHARQTHSAGSSEWDDAKLFGTVWVDGDGDPADAPESEPRWQDIATITGIEELTEAEVEEARDE